MRGYSSCDVFDTQIPWNLSFRSETCLSFFLYRRLVWKLMKNHESDWENVFQVIQFEKQLFSQIQISSFRTKFCLVCCKAFVRCTNESRRQYSERTFDASEYHGLYVSCMFGQHLKRLKSFQFSFGWATVFSGRLLNCETMPVNTIERWKMDRGAGLSSKGAIKLSQAEATAVK